ncbi:MAG: glycosyltransferase family 4 protein [Candidatus Omnitrophota bacterium]
MDIKTDPKGAVKITRIITRLNVGGPAIHTVLLTSELNRLGYSDTLVCGNVSESEGDMMYLAKEKDVIPLVVAEMGREISPVNDIKAFWKLYRIIRKARPDIVHTHTAKAGTLGRLAAICAGVPVKVHTFHGHVFDGYFNPLKAKIFLWIERFLALFTDRVITVSDKVKDEIVNKLRVTDGSKCVVVPLGFELEKFLKNGADNDRFRKKLRIDKDILLIGIVGRLVPIKNHEMFLEAARIVLDSGFKGRAKFAIIGDGELRSHLGGVAQKLGLEKDVIFTGWEQDLDMVYAGLDIVALTSLNEGTPVSIIEALASARPVVASDVGGVGDVINDGECGFLVKSGDVKGFSEKLLRLLDDSTLREKFGARGRELVKEKYSKNRLVRDIEQLYKECLIQKHNSRRS